MSTTDLQNLSSFQTTYSGWNFQTVWAPPNQAGQGGQSSANFPQLYALTPVVWATVDNATRTYGSANPSFTASSYGGPSQYVFGAPGDTLNLSPALSTTAAQGSNVGSYGIIAPSSAVSAGSVTYRVVSTAAGTLTITPATLSYVATPATSVYGATLPTLTGTVSGFVNNDNPSSVISGTPAFATTATSASNVGSYAITGSGVTLNSNNYMLAQASANATALTITPATLNYVATPATSVYGATLPTLTGTVSGFVNNDNPSSVISGTPAFATTATSASNVGSYAITGSGVTLNSNNYMLAQAPANATALTITPATLNYVATPATSVYGATLPTLTGTVSGFVNNDNPSSVISGTPAFTTTATSASNVGSYAITGGGVTLNSSNYMLAQASANATALTITPATLSYVATPVTATVGSIPLLTGTVTGFVNNDTLSSATSGNAAFTTPATSSLRSWNIRGGWRRSHCTKLCLRASVGQCDRVDDRSGDVADATAVPAGRDGK